MRQTVLANTAGLLGGLLALSSAPAVLQAQTAPSKCEVNQDKPKELALAYFNFTRLSGQPVGPTRDPLIKSILKDLMDKPEKFVSNPGGYNYILSQLFTMAATQDGGLTPTTRGAMGLTTRPNEPMDVLAELDSAYKRWEAAAPSCAEDIAASRSSEAWLAVTNKAFSFVDNGPADSAVYFAKRSIMLSPVNPFAHHILATVAASKKDMGAAVPEWKEVVKLSGADSSYKDIKLSALFYLGSTKLQEAAKASGDAQKTEAMAAASYFKEYLDVNPTSPDAPAVMNNWAQALDLAGDKAGQKAIYADLLANPAKYPEATLATAGVVAAKIEDYPASAQLFKSIVDVSPYSRDGLYNYASTLYSQDHFADAMPPLRKLFEIDPNNYDGLMMMAYAAQGMEKSVAATAKKQWTDTLIAYSTMAEKLPARVAVTGFTRSADGAEVTLSVEQAAEGQGNYTLALDFLDKAGNVVTSNSEAVGPIAKGDKKVVIIKGTGKDIAAFRYKALK